MKTDILNNIETDKTWIDVETVAKLKDISKQHKVFNPTTQFFDQA